MNNRKKRAERKEARAEKAPAPVPVHKIAKAAPPPSNRNKFRVAQMKRSLADQLPLNIRSRTGERLAADDKRPSLYQPELDQPQAQAIPKRKPQQTLASVQQPGLDAVKLSPLKCRPKDNAPKGAKGSGRSFVPWNDTCAS